jgi:ferredoxin
MAYLIDQSQCINCSWCRRECPTATIRYFPQLERKHWVDPDGCIDCDICAQVCPMGCISHDAAVVPPPIQLEAAKAKAREFARRRRQTKTLIRAYVERTIEERRIGA